MSTSLTVKPSSTGRTMIEFPQTRNIFEDLNLALHSKHASKVILLLCSPADVFQPFDQSLLQRT
jgi:hypothetical protein